MGLLDHAKRELKMAGFFDEDSDYGGMLGDSVMELMKIFAEQGHSGFSAGQTISIFSKLASYDVLGPYKPSIKRATKVGDNVWQCQRKYSVFSHDGGKTWKCIDSGKVWKDTPLQEFTEGVFAEDNAQHAQ